MAFHQNTNNAVRQPTPSAAIGHIISPLVTAHVAHTHTHTHTLRFNGHFSRWTWVSWLPP